MCQRSVTIALALGSFGLGGGVPKSMAPRPRLMPKDDLKHAARRTCKHHSVEINTRRIQTVTCLDVKCLDCTYAVVFPQGMPPAELWGSGNRALRMVPVEADYTTRAKILKAV